MFFEKVAYHSALVIHSILALSSFVELHTQKCSRCSMGKGRLLLMCCVEDRWQIGPNKYWRVLTKWLDFTLRFPSVLESFIHPPQTPVAHQLTIKTDHRRRCILSLSIEIRNIDITYIPLLDIARHLTW